MSGPQVTLVEDDANVARLVELGLQRQGYEVRTVATMADARRIVSAGSWDILLLDRRLPDGDGIELCNEVRDQNPHGYIIMLTGDATKEGKLQGFGCGADDYVTKPFQLEELVARVRAGSRIVELQKQLLKSNRQLEELARTDSLTGLRNRRSFDQEFLTRFGHAFRYSRPLAVAMLDIDHFKKINDERGHPAGDEVLQRVASILRRCTRSTDLVARYGGEEFVIALPETPLFESLQVGEKIRAAIAADPMGATASMGIASLPHSQFMDAEAMIRAADQALYRAKARGRNRVEYERRDETTRPRSDQPSRQL